MMIEKGPLAYEKYKDIGLNQLVVYCVYRILKRQKTCTLEDIINECFLLFPKKFSLRKYPQWPDSRIVEKRVWSARTDKGWLQGKVKIGFTLTPAGLSVAREVEALLEGKKVPSRKIQLTPEQARTQEEAVLYHVISHPAFKKYKETGDLSRVGLFEVKDLCLLSPHAPADMVFQKLQEFRNKLDGITSEEAVKAKEFLGLCIELVEPPEKPSFLPLYLPFVSISSPVEAF